jgi:hypothetical protein
VGALVVLAPQAEPVAPGESCDSVVLVRNTGAEADVFDVLVQGAAAIWSRVEPDVVELGPDEEATVWITFSPPRTAMTPVGPVAFDVAVVSRRDPTFVGIESGQIQVAPYVDLSVSAGEAVVERRTFVAAVTIGNAGNARARATVCVRGLSDAPIEVDVGPGERKVVEVRAPIARRRQRDHVTIDVLSEGAEPLSVDARVPEPPSALKRDLTRSAVVLGFILFTALVVALMAARGGAPRAAPSVVALEPRTKVGSPDETTAPEDAPSTEPGNPTTTAAMATAARAPADLPLLVFVRTFGPNDRDLVVRAAGTRNAETRLRSAGTAEGSPALSPDHARIAYTRERSGATNVCVIAIAGGEASCGAAVGPSSGVAWRHDGAGVIVWRDGRLYEVAVDAGGPAQDATSLGIDVPSGRFALSPDGARVAYPDGRSVAVRPLAGGDPISLRANGAPEDPHWSPDGTRIVYAVGYQIVSAPVGDGAVRLLTGPRSVNGEPVVAGGWVVFRSNRTGQGDLYAVRTDATDGNESGLAQITDSPERDGEPAA